MGRYNMSNLAVSKLTFFRWLSGGSTHSYITINALLHSAKINILSGFFPPEHLKQCKNVYTSQVLVLVHLLSVPSNISVQTHLSIRKKSFGDILKLIQYAILLKISGSQNL